MPCMDCAADVPTQDGELVCVECAPQAHTRCAGCDEWYRDGSSGSDCVTCDRCDALVPDSQTIETVRGSTICDECRQDWYWQCQSCDGWNRDGADCGNGCCGEDCDCEDCRDEDDEGCGGLIHSYDYKPYPVFHGAGPLFLGPEIEIETPYYRDDDCAKIADSHLGALGYLEVRQLDRQRVRDRHPPDVVRVGAGQLPMADA